MTSSSVRLEGPNTDGVFVLHLCKPPNTINFELIRDIHSALDVVEAVKDGKPCGLVLTGQDRFLSNGLDITVLTEKPKKLILTFHKLLLRLLTLPVPTVAAINGHAFAGGAMLCMACDYRVMNKWRGYLCVNEVDIGLTLPPGMYGVLRARVDRSVWTEMMLGGKRFTATMALERRLVDETADPQDVLTKALAIAKSVASKGMNKIVYGGLKQQVFADEIKLLEAQTLGLGEVVVKQLEAKL